MRIRRFLVVLVFNCSEMFRKSPFLILLLNERTWADSRKSRFHLFLVRLVFFFFLDLYLVGVVGRNISNSKKIKFNSDTKTSLVNLKSLKTFLISAMLYEVNKNDLKFSV